MNKLYIGLAVLLLILLFAGGGYYYMNMSSRKASSVAPQNTEKTIPDAKGGMMSLTELLALGKNQQCSFSYEGNGTKVEGTSYISGKKVRSDFKTTTQNKPTQGSMIMDGEYLYTWSSMMPQGVKMKITDELQKTADDAKKDLAKNPQQFMNPNDKMDYKCQVWMADNKVFTPPTTVTFMDFSQQLEQVKDLQKSVTTPDSKCQACASLEGEAAALCKQSLKCE